IGQNQRVGDDWIDRFHPNGADSPDLRRDQGQRILSRVPRLPARFRHRFGDNFPLYMQVSRAGLVLHLSEHHGDASPGSTVAVNMRGVHEYQRELAGKDYKYMKPGIEQMPWGEVMTVTDPFSNHIRFCEPPKK